MHPILFGLIMAIVCFFFWFVGWSSRGVYDRKKNNGFQRRRAEALTEGRKILEDLRAGKRAFAGDDIRLVSQVFDLTLISLTEIGTNEDEVRKLLIRSGARATALSLVQALQQADNERQFESFYSNLNLVLESQGWLLADFGVNDIEKLRQGCRLRIARNKALEVTNLALVFSREAAQLTRQCKAAGCQVRDLSPAEWVDALVQLAQNQDHEPGPRSRLNQ